MAVLCAMNPSPTQMGGVGPRPPAHAHQPTIHPHRGIGLRARSQHTNHQAGVIETIFCLAAYFLVLLNNGLTFHDATHPDRVSPKLAAMAATAYYVTLILSQVRDRGGLQPQWTDRAPWDNPGRRVHESRA